ncbi:TPA: GHMP kinase [Candidatus Poribacteria bacterium]|nr:GHMP kinase [Candidatus Poribacteria bacterium]
MKKEKVIRARAPVRIDFGGGWTDVDIFTTESKGFVVNSAINIYSYVTVKKLSSKEVPARPALKNKSVRIYSADFDIYVEAEEVKRLEYNGNVDLAKAAIHQIGIQGGIDIITRSNAPAGSGLGTSASMGVALIGALSAFKGKTYLPYELAEQASLIEREKLKILGGKQDHYASALGGINFMEFMGEEVKVSKLQLSKSIICELEKSLVLCYTGKSRLSGDIHQKVRSAFENGETKTTQAIKNLKEIAVEMKNALLGEDLETFGKLLNDNWQNQKALHPSVTNPQIDEIIEIAKSNGAIGGKACGAGGGGCLLFYVQPDQEHIVRRKLEENKIRVIDFNFDFDGIQIWHTLEASIS